MNLLIKEVSLKGELLSNRLNAKLEIWQFTAQFCHRFRRYHTQFKPSVPEKLHENGPSLPCVSATQFL